MDLKIWQKQAIQLFEERKVRTVWEDEHRSGLIKLWQITTSWKWKELMANRKEIRNNTAEFLIFQIEGKEQGVEVFY